jgi:hypothetical protein
MSNLKLGCPSRSQESWVPKKVKLFPRSVISSNGGVGKSKNVKM